MAFSYDGDSGYTITIDGQPEKDAATGKAVKAANVIVQHVHTTASGNRDVNGVATPLVEVVGSGKGAGAARWHRLHRHLEAVEGVRPHGVHRWPARTTRGARRPRTPVLP